MCLVPLFVHQQRVSCGKCPECLRAVRSDWIYRADQQRKFSKFGYFITLTFNDAHLPSSERACFDCFRVFRKAYHKLRGKFDYLVTLERGDLYDRFHLHLLLYSDVSVPKNLIRKLWKNGFIKQNSISPKRIRYACSYMFKDDMYNKVRMYRASNGFGGVPSLPYRIRVKNGKPFAVPLPRYYCKKYPDASRFAREYYDNLYRTDDFREILNQCESRFNRLRARYGSKRIDCNYYEYLSDFIAARVRFVPTYCDIRDTVGSPVPNMVPSLSNSYRQLLRRVAPLIRRYGVRRSGNLDRYLMLDCPMSLRGLAIRARHRLYIPPSPPPVYVYRGNFEKKQLTLI